MKNFLKLLAGMAYGMAVVLFAFAPVTGRAAEGEGKPSFSIKVEDGKAVITDKNGKKTTVEIGTVAKTLDIGGVVIQVSFSTDPKGNFSLNVVPAPGNTAPLNFTVNGNKVQVAAPAPGSVAPTVVSVAVTKSGQTTIDAPIGGIVTVNGQPAAGSTGGPVDLSGLVSSPGGSSSGSGSSASNSGSSSASTSASSSATSSISGNSGTTYQPPAPPQVTVNLVPGATTKF